MYVDFIPSPDLRASELQHYVRAPIPLHIACLIREEMGSPAYQGKHGAAWYGHADFTEGQTRQCSIPFALRINIKGEAEIQCQFAARDAISMAIASLIPPLVAVPCEPPARGYHRMG